MDGGDGRWREGGGRVQAEAEAVQAQVGQEVGAGASSAELRVLLVANTYFLECLFYSTEIYSMHSLIPSRMPPWRLLESQTSARMCS